MDHFPLDRFPNEHPTPTSFSSSSHPPSLPPPHSSFHSSDEPDQFKISFLKGPKRKRLAKVCMRIFSQEFTVLTPSIDILECIPQACDACHKSKRRCDGTGQLTPPGSYLCAPVLIISLAPCSNWYVLLPNVPLMGAHLSDPPLHPSAILPPKTAPTQTLLAGLFPPPWHQKLTSPREPPRVNPDGVHKKIPTRDHQPLPPQALCHLHAENR